MRLEHLGCQVGPWRIGNGCGQDETGIYAGPLERRTRTIEVLKPWIDLVSESGNRVLRSPECFELAQTSLVYRLEDGLRDTLWPGHRYQGVQLRHRHDCVPMATGRETPHFQEQDIRRRE